MQDVITKKTRLSLRESSTSHPRIWSQNIFKQDKQIIWIMTLNFQSEKLGGFSDFVATGKMIPVNT